MSGGSYNYLCYVYTAEDLGQKQKEIERMRDRLRELADAAKAAGNSELQRAYVYAGGRTEYILRQLATSVVIARALETPWRAVEWLDSSDYGQDQTDAEVLAWFLAPVPPVARQ